MYYTGGNSKSGPRSTCDAFGRQLYTLAAQLAKNSIKINNPKEMTGSLQTKIVVQHLFCKFSSMGILLCKSLLRRKDFEGGTTTL